MKQHLNADTPLAGDPAPVRFIILQRTIGKALQLTRTRAPLQQQIIGWGVVAGIFVAAILCWGAVIGAAVLIYRHL